MDKVTHEWRKTADTLQLVEITERVLREIPIAEFNQNIADAEKAIVDFDAKKHTDEMQASIDSNKQILLTAKEIV